MGSDPIEASKNLSFGLLRNCLNCDSTAMVTYIVHFIWEIISYTLNHFLRDNPLIVPTNSQNCTYMGIILAKGELIF